MKVFINRLVFIILKIGNRDHHIKWSIIKHVAAYKAGSKRCNLCLEEKLLLMIAKKKNFLNKRSELCVDT